MTSARVLVPVKMAAAMVTAGTTIAEPDTAAGEVVWVSEGTYALDDLRTYSGSVWSCVKSHTGRTALPDADPMHWLRKGPTNRMAPFDDYRSTIASAATSLTYVLQPGFCNGVSLWQIEGDTYTITVKDAPGGAVVASKSGDLYAQAAGFYELLFAPMLKLESVSLDSIPLAPAAEFTITVSAATGNRVSIGAIKLGDWRMFIGNSDWGGVSYGASSGRQSYTYREYNDDGTLKRVIPRGHRRDVRCTVSVSAEEAMYADAILAEIIDTAVVFEASDLPRYGYLNTLGFLSAEMSAENFALTRIDINLKGNI